MSDMSPVIVPKSDQINADDLLSGPITITITDVKIKPGQDQPVSIFFEGSDKAYRCCKSMARVLVSAWGADASKYKGRSLTLYCDPKVKWAGMEVGGIRISHMSDIDDSMTMALTVTRANKKPFTVKPLVNAPKAAAPQVDGRNTSCSTAETDGNSPNAEHALGSPADAAAPNDAELIIEITRRVKQKHFDLAYDLARGITDLAIRDETNARIDKAKAYVETRT